MSPTQPTPPSKPAPPTVEMVTRAWHALSDHVLDGVGLDEPGCDCRIVAVYAKRVVDLFTGEPVPEPAGLGAVVVNPFTDQVWVRAAHPALPWQDPATVAPEQWSDPTCEDWFVWDDLPQPLVVQSPGWTPPPPTRKPEPRRFVSEPTGIGAVVADATGAMWIRIHDGNRPWLKGHPDDTTLEYVTNWHDLAQPVAVRSHGWQQP